MAQEIYRMQGYIFVILMKYSNRAF